MVTKARLLSKAFQSSATGDIKLKQEFADSSAPIVFPVEVIDSSSSLADSNEGVIDTFDGTTIRSALYTISANTAGDSEHQAQQIYVTHDGDTATLTTYGTLLHSASTIVMYDADIDSSDTVSIKADPQISQGLNFSFKRIDTPKPT
tara:strand:- start:475 stop:915 length:441 start_codon:yes stop_codon:yes gene_type:complete